MFLDLYDEYDKYCYQYNSAIFRLLDKNPDVSNMINPLSNLIHQRIENELKIFIVEPHVSGNTYKDCKVENTHKLDLLLLHENLKKYYDDIEICKNIFEKYKESILYFYKILGEYTFEKSRYPFEKETAKITDKKSVDIDDLYENWKKFSLASGKMMIIYMAYCSSNTIIKLKNSDKIVDDRDESELIRDIIDNSFKGIDENFIDDEKEDLYMFIKAFIKRNKYYDNKYIC